MPHSEGVHGIEMARSSTGLPLKKEIKKIVDVEPRDSSLIFLNQFNLDRGDVSSLALFAKHFSPYDDLFD